MLTMEMPTVAEPSRMANPALPPTKKRIASERPRTVTRPPQAKAPPTARPSAPAKSAFKPRPIGVGRPESKTAAEPSSPLPDPTLPPQQPAPAPAPPPSPTLTQAQAFDEIVKRANAGNDACLAGMRQVLDSKPEIWQKIGNVGTLAEEAWINLVAGDNKLVEESVRRRLNKLTIDLAGDKATPLERLVVGHVGVTWLAASRAEAEAAEPADNLPRAAFRLKQAESAQRRFAGAARTLATIRALLPG
jgi:hypothetical protein